MSSRSKNYQKEKELIHKLKTLVPRYDFQSNDFSGESMHLINRILKDCIRLGVVKSPEELENVFDALSLLNLNQLNEISKDEICRKGSYGIIKYCKDKTDSEKQSYFKTPEPLV